MNYLLDKLFIFLFAVVLSLVYALNDFSLAVFCTSLIVTCLYYILEKDVNKIILTIIFAILSIWVPEFIYFIPLVLYDIAFTKIQIYGVFLIPAIIIGIDLKSEIVIIFIILIVFSLFSKYKKVMIDSLKSKYINYRDSTTEYNNLLKEKNRQLITNQDYELRVATLNERNRISKELHDSIGHLLSRSLIQVGALSVITKEDGVKRGLNELKESLSEGMDSVRETIHNIRDEAFDLHTNIQELLKGFSMVPLHFEYNLQSDPPIDVKYCVISTIKESLSNIVKHSSATELSITLLEHTSLYQLIIFDNGRVVNKDYVESCIRLGNARDGMGLSGMVERVQNLKGIINFTMDKGFKIFITIPKI